MKQSLRPSHRAARAPGLTLIEVLVAIVILNIGVLGLAAASAAIVRQMSMNSQRGYSASIAGIQSEQFHAAPCSGSASGAEWTRGLRSEWTRVGSEQAAELDHRIRRSTASGMREDRFLSGVPCE